MYTQEKNLISASFVIKVLLALEQKQDTKEVIWDLSVTNRLVQSSIEQNMVLSRNLLQLTLAEVPRFAQLKIVHNTLLKFVKMTPLSKLTYQMYSFIEK